jgi:hypothetical protein
MNERARKRSNKLAERSVQVRPETKDDESGSRNIDRTGIEVNRGEYQEEVEASKRWVGFDDEMVIVLKESGRGTQALMVYDFT